MVDISHIGKEWNIPPAPVEAGRIRFFSKAIGETDPVYYDDEAARAAGYRGLLAPPTYAMTLEIDQLDPIQMLSGIDIDISTILHGEQKFKYHLPICAGDVISSVVCVKDVYDKKKGAMTFVEVNTSLYNQDKQLVVEAMRIIIVMNNKVNNQ